MSPGRQRPAFLTTVTDMLDKTIQSPLALPLAPYYFDMLANDLLIMCDKVLLKPLISYCCCCFLYCAIQLDMVLVLTEGVSCVSRWVLSIDVLQDG